jgi:hypothetical protein
MKEEAMKCSNCGAEMSPADRFCGGCGTPSPLSIRPTSPPGSTPGSALPPVSKERKRGRRLLLPVLAVLALGAVMVVGGIVAVGTGALKIERLLPYRAGEKQILPEGQVSLTSFQAAVKECRPIAGVGEIHEGVDMDVLVRVEGLVGKNCRIYQEIIRDGTGRGLTGKRMTCWLPMEALIAGSRPDGDLKDYCKGSLMDAIERSAPEER